MSKPIIHALLVVAFSLMLTACGKPPEEAHEEQAGDPVALGERKARVCMSCHGPGGVSRVASYPSLAGLQYDYIVTQLRAFKSGSRENPMMNAMVASLSDTDMQHLAAYFAAQGQ
ncbi:c-type cytochrome [Gilvimarinus agarilyticus]|uniref:c-type cytochrome n=1 Tax=Gilvimarinus agarilyticus TaxID=679259 RepID=UPI0006969628|nr:cytochrome c [Gilvimarinus agarilyticus]